MVFGFDSHFVWSDDGRDPSLRSVVYGKLQRLPLLARRRFARQRSRWCAGVTALSWPQTISVPARILVVGDDLLAGALASALTAHGFSSMHVMHRQARVARGIRWRPSLVIVDAGSLDSAAGEALVATICRAGLRVCVIDACGEAGRLGVWRGLGTSAFVQRNAPFDELFRTVNQILLTDSPALSSRATPASRFAGESSVESPLESFADLTEREQFVLAELIEGHCANEIARASFVSISTVRSQIKSILQKLGVSSQLAAVALARRAGWSLEEPPVQGAGALRSRRAGAM